ncbi:MAG: hypothetical protein IH624_04785 [Phycisphaerae bacterium]|nr:hypothetical protein [Phycisphaerae bacterium]
MRHVTGFLVFCCVMALLATAAQGAVVHRYAFDDPNDSVGGADGVLINRTGRAAFANGQLTLGNLGVENSNTNDGDYLDLPNGIISALGDQATFEVWTTWRGAAMWERIFDLGASDGGEGNAGGAGNSFYIFLTPRGGSEQLRFGMNKPVPTRVEVTINDGAGNLVTNVEQHIVISWDGAGQSLKMFRNGELVSEGQMHFALSDIPDINNWLGRAQWPDTMYVGSYNEFRIYDHAMNASEVAASLAAGTEKSPASPVYPADGAKDIPTLFTLEWAPGILPAGTTDPTYTLYFSNDAAAVEGRSSTAKVGDFEVTSLAMPAALLTDQTYYWVVDETVTLPGMSEPNVIAGGSVSFETIKTLPVLSAPASMYGIAGKPLTLTVGIVTLSDIVGCTWFKHVDGVSDIALADGDKYAIGCSAEATTLAIADLTAEDSGAYYCVVENAAGSKLSTSIAVDVRQGLVHRYTFNTGSTDDPNVFDVVGGAHGVLINNTGNARYEAGQLVLGNGGGQNSGANNGDYVDLPNGIISALGNLATIETWVTWGGPAWSYWQRIFDLGTSDGGEGTAGGAANSYYLMMSPWGGERMLRTGYRRGPSAEERVMDDVNGALSIGRQTHLAVVWDGKSGIVRMYRDGRQVGQNNLHFALSDIPDNNNWLGRAQWGDPLFVGRYNEFRIYDVPLSADAVLAHYQAGPDVVDVDLPCTAYPAGDANGDCKVDLSDLAIMADTWLTCGGPMCE